MIHLLTVIILSTVPGTAMTQASPPQPQEDVRPGGCFGLNVEWKFTADRYKRPWLENSAAPFNFANLFDFDFLDPRGARVEYARVEFGSSDANPHLILFAANTQVLRRKKLDNAKVECGTERSVLNYSYSVHGADSFGGSNRHLTLTFMRVNEVVRATSRIDLDSRWLVFRSSTETRENWAEFSRYSSGSDKQGR